MVVRPSTSALTLSVALLVFFGVEISAKTQTLKGRLVDQVCYGIDNSNIGDSHPGMATDCATTCAQKGSPVALLTVDGKLYEIAGRLAANNNAMLVPHIAHVVQITGNVTVYKDGTRSIVADRLVMIAK